MNTLKGVVGVIGSIIVVYFGVRITATIIDACQHLYLTLAAKGPKGRIIPQLSFWSELEQFVKTYRDSGEFPFEDAPTIDWTKASPEDLKQLSTIKNPAKVIERQINLLFARNNLANKLEVRRDKNILYICPPSW